MRKWRSEPVNCSHAHSITLGGGRVYVAFCLTCGAASEPATLRSKAQEALNGVPILRYANT